ncbi:MAG: hypothetical protein M3Y12_10710, partial [Bacteroidota bacterium]|nr:hypothetical protein [Bacteroidota bacterium]
KAGWVFGMSIFHTKVTRAFSKCRNAQAQPQAGDTIKHYCTSGKSRFLGFGGQAAGAGLHRAQAAFNRA